MTTSMHTLFGGLKLAGIGAVGVGVGFLADLAPALTPDTHVPIGTAVGVGVACLGAAFWLSRQLTKLQDGQKSLRDGQVRLEEGFKNLPCHRWMASEADCPTVPHPKPK